MSRLEAFKAGTYPYGQVVPGGRMPTAEEEARRAEEAERERRAEQNARAEAERERVQAERRAERKARTEAERERAAREHAAIVETRRLLKEGGRLLLLVYGRPDCAPPLAEAVRRAKELARGSMDTRQAVYNAAVECHVEVAALVEVLRTMRGARC